MSTSISWKKNDYPGIRYGTGRLGATPQNVDNVNVLAVDLTHPGVRFFATPKGQLEAEGVRTTSFLDRNHDAYPEAALFAVNANFFEWPEPRNVFYGPLYASGHLVRDENGDPPPPYYSLVLGESGHFAAIVPATEIPTLDWSPWTAVSGEPLLVQDGAVCPNLDNVAIAARTAVGLSGPRERLIDPPTLFVLTIDGVEPSGCPDNPPDYGATYRQTADLLHELGAEVGFNLDGGGSTTMARRPGLFGPDAELMNVAHDSECVDKPGERLVAVSFGIAIPFR